jgi:hypothetical protein
LPKFFLPMSENDILKRITEIEYELFLSIRNGHRAAVGDQYHDIRVEVTLLRCMYYGQNSKYCKK